MEISINKNIKSWWSENPYTYAKDDGVKKQDNLDLRFFEKCEYKFRRHGATHQDVDQPLISNFVDFKKIKSKVLDIACGTGVLTVEFAKQGFDVTAIDITPTAYDMTKTNLSLRGLHADVQQMDMNNLTFPDNTFNFVCAHGCVMHSGDTNQSVKEIYRVLALRGLAYFWIYHKGFYYYFNIIFVRGVLLLGLLKNGFNVLRLTSRWTDGASAGGNPHTDFYSKKEFNCLLKANKFKIIKGFTPYNPSEFDGIPFKRLPVARYLPPKIKQFLGKYFGISYVAVVEK